MTKKLLSTVLSVCMLLTAVLALPVMAEDTAAVAVSATEDTFIELEDYVSSVQASVLQREGTHGGAYLFTGSGSTTAQSIDILLSVEKTDVYALEFVAAYADWLSVGDVLVNGVPVISLKSTEKTSMDSDEGTYFDPKSDKTNNYPAYKYVVPVMLLAGQQTLSFKLEPRGEQYGGGIGFAADYFKLTPGAEGKPVNPVVFETGDTYIELEDYAKQVGVAVVEREGTHGGAYAFNGGGGSATQTFNIPVTVEKSGAYILEYVGSDAGWLSYGTICVNGAAVISVRESAKVSVEPEEGTYFDPKSETMNNFPAYKYTVPVALYEGAQNISLNFYLREASGAAYAADYIKLTPITSEVAVSDTEETYIEFENYVSSIAFGYAKSHEKAHGGSILKSDFYPTADRQTATALVVPFHAEKAGYYDIEIQMNKMGNTYVSKIDVSIDDTYLFSNDSADSTDVSEDNTFLDKNWPMHLYNDQVYLAEGEHFLQFYINNATSQNLLSIAADYIKFAPATEIKPEPEPEPEPEPVPEPVVTATGDTYIELENYAKEVGVSVIQREGTHGGAYAFNGGSGSETQIFNIPVTVEKSGAYMLEYVGSNANWLSHGTISVNGAAVISVRETAKVSVEPEEGTYFDPMSETMNDFPAYKYTVPVALYEGSQNLSVNFYIREASGAAYAADYIKLTPIVSETAVSATEETYLEMESLNGKTVFGGSKAHDLAHNEAYLHIGWYVDTTVTPAGAFAMPFSVEKAGFYDIDARMNRKGNSYVSKNTVSLDGYTLFTNDGSVNWGVDFSEDNTYFDANWPMYSYYNRVYLTEGQHVLNFHMEKAVSQNLITLFGDYVKFTPVTPYAVTADTPALVEAESLINNLDCSFLPKLAENEPAASGNGYLYSLGGGKKPTKFMIPFEVESDGVYTFDTVMAYANYLSEAEIYLDGSEEPVYVVNASTTQTSVAAQPFNANANIDKVAALYQFDIELKEGQHCFTIEYKNRDEQFGGTPAFAVDYFRLTALSVDQAIVDTTAKTISVNAEYLEPTSGLFLIVAYSGNKMVGIKEADLMDVSNVTDTVSYTGDVAPDKVKVFVFDSYYNLIPQVKAKTIAVK